jgi:hypothetical protein
MWSERFVKDETYKMYSNTNQYEVWIPVHWFTEPDDDVLARLESVARKALDTNPAWRVPRGNGLALRWISNRSFDRIVTYRFEDRPDGHIRATYIVIIETESICD